MRDNLDGVTVFIEVVESGSFARAAERLALSRSAVGKTIARLENRLGVRLFHRTTRVQALTEEGHIFYERCLRAIGELRAGIQLLESGRREVVGKLKIALPLLFGRYCVQPILLDLARNHPELSLELSYSDKIVDILGEGYDLAIRNGRIDDFSGLKARKIATQVKVICASPAYLDSHGTPLNVEDLLKHQTLMYVRNGVQYPWKLRDPSGSFVEPQVGGRLVFDSQEAIADAAIGGFGIAWLPSWLVQEQLGRGDLISLLEDLPQSVLETYAVWPSSEHIPMRLRVVIDTLAKRLPLTLVN